MVEQRIQQHFIESADLKYQAAQTLSKPISAAVQALLACVTSGGKVLACGNGASATDAIRFTAAFLGRFERERPSLGAVSLTADRGAVVDAGSDGVFERQVRALGQTGDVLLALSVDGNCSNVVQAIDAAHEREMTVIAITGQTGGKVGDELRDTDVHINVPHDRPARIYEIHLLALHCLCDGVDAQLLGEQEPT